jgi:hypothetical protein
MEIVIVLIYKWGDKIDGSNFWGIYVVNFMQKFSQYSSDLSNTIIKWLLVDFFVIG